LYIGQKQKTKTHQIAAAVADLLPRLLCKRKRNSIPGIPLRQQPRNIFSAAVAVQWQLVAVASEAVARGAAAAAGILPCRNGWESGWH